MQGDRKVGKYIDAHGGAAAFAKVRPYLQTADLAFINLEGPVSDKGTQARLEGVHVPQPHGPRRGLAAAGIDVVSMANNHAMDCGQPPCSTRSPGSTTPASQHAGGGRGRRGGAAPCHARYARRKGRGARLHGQHAERLRGRADHPGVATIGDGQKVLAAIAAAEKKADYVIVSFHWGTEYTSQAASLPAGAGPQSVDAGADLILGHHPHVIQGFEVYNDKLIAYSLGDFVFDHRPGPTGAGVHPAGDSASRRAAGRSDHPGLPERRQRDPRPCDGKSSRRHPRPPDQAERCFRGGTHPLGRPGLTRVRGTSCDARADRLPPDRRLAAQARGPFFCRNAAVVRHLRQHPHGS